MPSSRSNLTTFKTYKLQGEWAELYFMTRSAEHGLMVSKPWGDSARYDFMVEHNGSIRRVQVKSTSYKHANSYKCQVHANGLRYLESETDFIAALVVPTDTWYIIPVSLAGLRTQIVLAPHSKHSKYEPYREAWHLLL